MQIYIRYVNVKGRIINLLLAYLTAQFQLHIVLGFNNKPLYSSFYRSVRGTAKKRAA
jgi:hypothetical protein